MSVGTVQTAVDIKEIVPRKKLGLPQYTFYSRHQVFGDASGGFATVTFRPGIEVAKNYLWLIDWLSITEGGGAGAENPFFTWFAGEPSSWAAGATVYFESGSVVRSTDYSGQTHRVHLNRPFGNYIARPIQFGANLFQITCWLSNNNLYTYDAKIAGFLWPRRNELDQEDGPLLP